MEAMLTYVLSSVALANRLETDVQFTAYSLGHH